MGREGWGRKEIWKAGTGLEEGERAGVWSVNCRWGLKDVKDGYAEGKSNIRFE